MFSGVRLLLIFKGLLSRVREHGGAWRNLQEIVVSETAILRNVQGILASDTRIWFNLQKGSLARRREYCVICKGFTMIYGIGSAAIA